jgi:uncharacterized glyoxalase superfamily protein PhnB
VKFLKRAPTWLRSPSCGRTRVFLFLHTDDFWRDYDALRSRGVKFVEEPRHETFGTVAVFVDLYGNKWDLVERTAT